MIKNIVSNFFYKLGSPIYDWWRNLVAKKHVGDYATLESVPEKLEKCYTIREQQYQIRDCQGDKFLLKSDDGTSSHWIPSKHVKRIGKYNPQHRKV